MYCIQISGPMSGLPKWHPICYTIYVMMHWVLGLLKIGFRGYEWAFGVECQLKLSVYHIQFCKTCCWSTDEPDEVAGPAGAWTCYPYHREESSWFFLSAALCAKTWVLPMELGGSWCYCGLWLIPDGASQASQLHLNPPNLGSQTLRLQRDAALFTLLRYQTKIMHRPSRLLGRFENVFPCFQT